MGGGIAMSFANAGIPVTVLEKTQEALDRGLRPCPAQLGSDRQEGPLTQPRSSSAWRCCGRR
jgi:3-hydroxyacyl-CoA dehydrogenase